MRILMYGFLALSAWSSLSTYIYVCKIKGLCNEQVSGKTITDWNNAKAYSLITRPSKQEETLIPANLIIYFAYDKYALEADAGADNYIYESNKYLAQNSQARIKITGYTDAVGSDEYNKALGFRRAHSMQAYFESKGMPENKIIIESMGEKKPLENNNTTIGRATNRRTAITIKQ
jgi:outer membrane protein OmpA-like peptidoglycan-associated protein